MQGNLRAFQIAARQMRLEQPAQPAGVDRLCEALFLSARARERDDNLLFVRDRILRAEVDTAALLELYDRVRAGRATRVDETNSRPANHSHPHRSASVDSCAITSHLSPRPRSIIPHWPTAYTCPSPAQQIR